MNGTLRTTVAVVLVTAGCVGVAAAQTDSSVGRIVDFEPFHGYVVVEFQNGRMNVSMDQRQMGQYSIGDEIRVDSFGRPLPPPPGGPRRPSESRRAS
jgi:hypothetical protein